MSGRRRAAAIATPSASSRTARSCSTSREAGRCAGWRSRSATAFDWAVVPNPCGPAACTRHARRRRLRRVQADEVAQGGRALSRLHGAARGLREMDERDREHPGRDPAAEIGRRALRALAGRQRGDAGVQPERDDALADRLPAAGLSLQPGDLRRDRGPAEPGDRRADHARRGVCSASLPTSPRASRRR